MKKTIGAIWAMLVALFESLMLGMPDTPRARIIAGMQNTEEEPPSLIADLINEIPTEEWSRKENMDTNSSAIISDIKAAVIKNDAELETRIASMCTGNDECARGCANAVFDLRNSIIDFLVDCIDPGKITSVDRFNSAVTQIVSKLASAMIEILS